MLVLCSSLLSLGDGWRWGLVGFERGSLEVEPVVDISIVEEGRRK